MKKTIYYGFAVLLMLAVVGTAAAADDTSDVTTDITTAYACQDQGPNFADGNGDGVCDNFVDEDGDGINDNCAGYGAGNGGNGPRDGTGYRNGGAGGCNGGNCGQYNQ